MKKTEELTGRKLGRWTVLSRAEDYVKPCGKHASQYRCQCECGTIRVVRAEYLKSGRSYSCGCYQKEKAAEVCSELGKGNKLKNSYNLDGQYGIGTLNDGTTFKFDLEDYETIKDYCWSHTFGGFLRSRDKNRNTVYLHKVIMAAHGCSTTDKFVHKNGDVTDNRKENLVEKE